jgi:hypothetical protein
MYPRIHLSDAFCLLVSSYGEATQCSLENCTAKSIPTGAEYVALQNYFSHTRSIIYLFATLPKRLKQGLQRGGNH